MEESVESLIEEGSVRTFCFCMQRVCHEHLVGETPSPLMTRSPRYEPGEGSRAHTQCP